MAIEIARETKSKERRARGDRPPAAQPAVSAQSPQPPQLPPRVRGATSRTQAQHAVFLVPGLFGFERFSTFSYFADRVVAALRASLEQRLSEPVDVVAVALPPTASLQARQRRLINTLADRLHGLEHGGAPRRVHLVGHSTGGVDANLLTHVAPISGGRWSDIDPRAPALLARIRSVTSIGSPHQGACLAADPVVRALAEPSVNLRGRLALGKLVAEFAVGAIGDIDADSLWNGALREGDKLLRFLRDVLSTWALLGDLQPARSGPRSGHGAAARSDVRRRSFVTVAGNPVPGDGRVRVPDAFFRDLSDRASGFRTGLAEQGPLVRASVARLQQALTAASASNQVICAEGTAPPGVIDAGHNDGVVNAARQLIDPHDAGELAAIVVADHYDVLGYYDRQAWIRDENGHEVARSRLAGMLHSGSGFRDEQFFELYRRVAQEVVQAIFVDKADTADTADVVAVQASVAVGDEAHAR